MKSIQLVTALCLVFVPGSKAFALPNPSTPRVYGPQFSKKCGDAILAVQNRLSYYLTKDSSMSSRRIYSEERDKNYRLMVTTQFWNVAREYSSIPDKRKLLVDFIYGGGIESGHPNSGDNGIHNMRAIMNSPATQKKLALEIVSSCPEIGIVRYSPHRTTGVLDVYVAKVFQASLTVVEPNFIIPTCGGIPSFGSESHLLSWGEFWGEC